MNPIYHSTLTVSHVRQWVAVNCSSSWSILSFKTMGVSVTGCCDLCGRPCWVTFPDYRSPHKEHVCPSNTIMIRGYSYTAPECITRDISDHFRKRNISVAEALFLMLLGIVISFMVTAICFSRR
jgi:hypothetical protein